MAVVKILGIDPGLRNLGFGVICFDEENETTIIENCGVLKVPAKFTGNNAILYMKNELMELFATKIFEDIDKVVIEIPRSAFGGKFQSWALIPVGVVAGLVMGFFEVDNIVLCNPSEWNKCKKKEKTQQEMESIFGSVDNWGFVYEPKNQKHREHIIDAIGMAYWHLKESSVMS